MILKYNKRDINLCNKFKYDDYQSTYIFKYQNKAVYSVNIPNYYPTKGFRDYRLSKTKLKWT